MKINQERKKHIVRREERMEERQKGKDSKEGRK
jgi:hypothetical protein